MKSIDIKNLAEILTGMCVIHGREANTALVDLYFRALHEWDFEDVSDAFATHVKISEYFPKPKDIEEILKTKREAEKTKLVGVILGPAFRGEKISDKVLIEKIEEWGGYPALVKKLSGHSTNPGPGELTFLQQKEFINLIFNDYQSAKRLALTNNTRLKLVNKTR